MDQELKAYLDAKFSEAEERLAERIKQSEDNMLRAFHGWARSMEIRVSGISAVAVGFEERLSLLEERISAVEWKKAS